MNATYVRDVSDAVERVPIGEELPSRVVGTISTSSLINP